MKKVTLLICLLFLLALPVQAETVEEKLNPTQSDTPTTKQVDESPSMALTIFK
jgi:flagellar protein FliO/FliZ